MHKFNLVKKF